VVDQHGAPAWLRLSPVLATLFNIGAQSGHEF
jgi:hypothetical protein